MDIRTLGILPTSSVRWQNRTNTWALTLICKATFRLLPDESPLAPDQEPITEEDGFWNDDPSRSIYAPTDTVPFKVRVDVLLVGSAFAPSKQPVQSLSARLVAGDIDKSIEVVGDRTVRDAQGRASPATPFLKMPLRYERARGGPNTINPVGVRVDTPFSPGAPLPNLYISKRGLPEPSHPIAPIGFGPISASWPERRKKLGAALGAWPFPGWNEKPMPPGLDPSFFNMAPSDQTLEALRSSQLIVLENLHPEHPKLVTTLAEISPKALIDRPGAPQETIDLKADTLWIDTDRGLCTLTWRVPVSLKHKDEPLRITLITADPPNTDEDDLPVQTLQLSPGKQQAMVLPFIDGHSRGIAGKKPPLGIPNMPAGVLNTPVDTGTLTLPDAYGEPIEDGAEVLVLSEDVQTLPPPPLANSPQAPAPIPQSPLPPSPILPMPPQPILTTPEKSPWAASGGIVARPQTAPAPEPFQPAPGLGHRAAVGVKAASDAAVMADKLINTKPPSETPAKPIAKEPEAKAKPREILKLLWFDSKVLNRARKHPRWAVLLAEMELRMLDREDEEAEIEDEQKRAEAKAKREVREILMKGDAVGAEALSGLFRDAVDEDGSFESPLVLVGGELDIPFDEIEVLKATAAAVGPFAASDKSLKETVETVNELMKTPWLSGASGIAENLTARLKQAFSATKRPGFVEFGSIDTHVERTLLDKRAYQKRTIGGKTWIRAVMGAGTSGSVPVYLPEALSNELPLFRRIRVKMLSELDMKEDQYESSAYSLKVQAMGRVMGP